MDVQNRGRFLLLQFATKGDDGGGGLEVTQIGGRNLWTAPKCDLVLSLDILGNWKPI